MIRIIIKINNRTLYNIQAVNTSDVRSAIENLGNYDATETIRGIKFIEKDYPREKGALELTVRLIKNLIKKERSLK